MLRAANVYADIPAKDLSESKKFYEDVLGLLKIKEDENMVFYQSGDTYVMVYVSEFAGTNKATAATWEVDDVEEVVGLLKQRGVEFEHYDMPGIERNGDIHVADDYHVAWFKDPAGNILCLANPA